MTRDIIELNNFTVLIEKSADKEPIVEKCTFHDDVIGFSFYGSGNVQLNITDGISTKTFNNTRGIVISFYANKEVEFIHNIFYQKPLQCICVFITIENLKKLPKEEAEMFIRYVGKPENPQAHYIEGPYFYMSPDMLSAVDKIFNTTYSGPTRTMFLTSQVTELLAHFFAIVSESAGKNNIKQTDREKLYQAKEILAANIETPPSLQELSKLIGLNNYKLKKNFKELFGVPVFKYLQNERLNKAHHLLSTSDMNIQEVAGSVGYESMSSFSGAFLKKFGFRPSEIKSFSNKS